MKILVTGSNGQLGHELYHIAKSFPSFIFVFIDIEQVNIIDKKELSQYICFFRPNIVINCAAFTAVDKAETEQDSAFAVNVEAVDYLSELSNEFDFFLIHISTDYVFDGKHYMPYMEDAAMKPESYYGLSKSAGEIQMRQHCQHGAIIRASWLFSSYGNNFVKTILKKSKKTNSLHVVEDQIGTPTYAADLAQFLLGHLEMIRTIQGVETYHFSNSGVASWYDFSCAIVEIAKIDCSLTPVPTKDYPTTALRPYYSVMNKEKIKKRFNYVPRHWKSALVDCITKLEL